MIHCYVLYNSLFCHYINKRKGEPPDDVKLRLETPDKSDRRTGLPIVKKDHFIVTSRDSGEDGTLRKQPGLCVVVRPHGLLVNVKFEIKIRTQTQLHDLIMGLCGSLVHPIGGADFRLA